MQLKGKAFVVVCTYYGWENDTYTYVVACFDTEKAAREYAKTCQEEQKHWIRAGKNKEHKSDHDPKWEEVRNFSPYYEVQECLK